MRVVSALIAAAAVACASATMPGIKEARDTVVAQFKAAEAFRQEHIIEGKRHAKVSAAVRDAVAHQGKVEAALPAPWRAVIDAARTKSSGAASLHGRGLQAFSSGFGHPLEAPLECYTSSGGRVNSACCNAYWTVDTDMEANCPGNVTAIEDSLRTLRNSAPAGVDNWAAQANTAINNMCANSCLTAAKATFAGVASETGRGCPKIAYSSAYLDSYLCANSGSTTSKCLMLQNNPHTSSVFEDATGLKEITPGNATLACGCATANKARLDAEVTYLQSADWALVAQTENIAVSASGLRAIGFALSAGPRIEARTMGWACSTAPGSTALCVNEAVAQGAIANGNVGGFGLFDECAWDFTCSFCGKTLQGHYLGFLKSTTDNACALSDFTTAANNGTADAELVSLCQSSPVDAGNQGATGSASNQAAGNGVAEPGNPFGSIISILETIMSLACGRAPNGQICANVLFSTCDASGQAGQNSLLDTIFSEDCGTMTGVSLYSALGVSDAQLRSLLPPDAPSNILTDCSTCQDTIRPAATAWGCCITGYQEFIIQTFTALIDENGVLQVGGDDDASDDDAASGSGGSGPDLSGLTFNPPARPAAAFASKLNSLCGTDLPNGKCASSNAASLTARLTNVDYDWVVGTAERRAQFVQRFTETVSANTGAGIADITVDSLSRGSVRVAYTVRAETNEETTRISSELETLLPASGASSMDWTVLEEYLASSCVSATDCPCTGGACSTITAEGSSAAIAEANDDFSESSAAPILASLATLATALAAAFALRQ